MEDRIKALSGIALEVFEALEHYNGSYNYQDSNVGEGLTLDNLKLAERIMKELYIYTPISQK